MLAQISPLQFSPLEKYETSPSPSGSLSLRLKAAVTSPLSAMPPQFAYAQVLLLGHDL